MASGQTQVSAETIEKTKQQIRGLVSEIAQLSKSDLGPEEFYSGFLQRVVQAFVLGRVVIGRERVVEARHKTLHGAVRKLRRVQVAVDIVRLDDLDRLLQLGGVDPADRVMSEIWKVRGTGECLVDVQTGDESK